MRVPCPVSVSSPHTAFRNHLLFKMPDDLLIKHQWSDILKYFQLNHSPWLLTRSTFVQFNWFFSSQGVLPSTWATKQNMCRCQFLWVHCRQGRHGAFLPHSRFYSRKDLGFDSLATLTIMFSDEPAQLNKLEEVNDTGSPTAVFKTGWWTALLLHQ